MCALYLDSQQNGITKVKSAVGGLVSMIQHLLITVKTGRAQPGGLNIDQIKQELTNGIREFQNTVHVTIDIQSDITEMEQCFGRREFGKVTGIIERIILKILQCTVSFSNLSSIFFFIKFFKSYSLFTYKFFINFVYRRA